MRQELKLKGRYYSQRYSAKDKPSLKFLSLLRRWHLTLWFLETTQRNMCLYSQFKYSNIHRSIEYLKVMQPEAGTLWQFNHFSPIPLTVSNIGHSLVFYGRWAMPVPLCPSRFEWQSLRSPTAPCSSALTWAPGWERKLGSKLLLEGQARGPEVQLTKCLYSTAHPGNIKNYAWKSK